MISNRIIFMLPIGASPWADWTPRSTAPLNYQFDPIEARSDQTRAILVEAGRCERRSGVQAFLFWTFGTPSYLMPSLKRRYNLEEGEFKFHRKSDEQFCKYDVHSRGVIFLM